MTESADIVIQNERPDPEKAVFINCPFDANYEPLLRSIVFATVCCGFLPRSAVDSGTVSDSRMNRIAEAIFSCRYSIHDLSRCRGEGSEALARFNMPLELGMAMARRFTADQTGDHDWLILVPDGHQYVKFISDLAGFDPKTHDETPGRVIQAVMSWLATRPNAIPTPTPKQVLSELPKFEADVIRLTEEWGTGTIPWRALVQAAASRVPPVA
jgi:hypothetical protein